VLMTPLSAFATVVAQVDAETYQTPETPPNPWTDQFIAWPVMFLIAVVFLGFITTYVLKMYRLRYPSKS